MGISVGRILVRKVRNSDSKPGSGRIFVPENLSNITPTHKRVPIRN